jgi:hypothetical protein
MISFEKKPHAAATSTHEFLLKIDIDLIKQSKVIRHYTGNVEKSQTRLIRKSWLRNCVSVSVLN